MAEHIKQINLGGDVYELLPKFIQDNEGNPRQWSDITTLIGAGIQLTTSEGRKEGADDGPIGAPVSTASSSTMGNIYLVEDGAITGTYVEWITVDKGSLATPQYMWEKIGTTDTDLSEYVKKGNYSTNSTGAHTHTVTATIEVPTVAKTDKHLAASASGTAVDASGRVNAITSFGDHTTDAVLGADTTFAVSGGKGTVSHIKATATGVAVAVEGTESVITSLGAPTTAQAVTGYAAPVSESVVTGYKAPTTDAVLGADTTFAVVGGAVTKETIKATASGTTINSGSDTFVKSYPGTTSKLVTETITPVNGIQNVPSSVSVSAGSAASWSASVNGGVLSFNWSANRPTSVAVGSNVAVAKAGSAKTVVTGIDAEGNGATIMTGMGTPVTASALTSATIGAQPIITLAKGEGAGSYDVATGIGSITVSANKNNTVTALTGLGEATTTNALTGLGAPTTAAVITGFAEHNKANVAKGVKVTAQPTISLAAVEAGGVGIADVVTAVSGVSVTANKNDSVNAITALGKANTASVVTGVKVTAQPTISLNGEAPSGIAYVSAVTIGSKSASANGTAASAGAHTHSITL